MKRPLYRILAGAIAAYKNCEDDPSRTEWRDRHREHIEHIMKNLMPSGSGWDLGTKFDFDNSNGERLVMFGEFHHMNDGGMYDGWTAHTITVKPSLQFGIDIHVKGKNRNEIKDYLHEMFHQVITEEYTVAETWPEEHLQGASA